MCVPLCMSSLDVFAWCSRFGRCWRGPPFLRIFPLNAPAMACLGESEWYFNRPGKPRWKRMDDWFLENLSKGMEMARLQIWQINSVVRRYSHSRKVSRNCVFERAVVLRNGNLRAKGLSGKTCCTQVGPAAPQLLEMQRFEVLFEHRLHFLYHPLFISPLLSSYKIRSPVFQLQLNLRLREGVKKWYFLGIFPK